MGIESEIKGGGKAARQYWLFFLAAGVALVVGALWYDHKHSGALTAKFASIPGLGKLFA